MGQSKDYAIHALVKSRQDHAETIVHTAFRDLRLLMVTLKSGKVYIGLSAKDVTAEDPLESVMLWLQFSGYRNLRTHQLHITTDYSKIIDHIISESFRLPNEIDDASSNRLEEMRKATDFPQFMTTEGLVEKGSDVLTEEQMSDLEDKTTNALSTFTIAIPIRVIQTITFFDPDIFAAGHNQDLSG